MPETVPLHHLRIDPADIPASLPQARRMGWECVFCGDQVGGAAPVAGRIEIGDRLAVCFCCMRKHGTPEVAA